MENKITTLEEMRELLREATHDADILLDKKYTKARAKRLRAKLDKIANLKIQLRKEMLAFERGE